MLSYDSVGPSTLRLSLISRDLLVDLGDPDAPKKIKTFMQPLDGWKRFHKNYEQCLDSLVDEKCGEIKYIGEFIFTADYADSSDTRGDKIKGFVTRLATVSEIEKADVEPASALYAGYNTANFYRPVYAGSGHDISGLSDFLAHKTFENWRRGGNADMISSGAALSIKAHIANERFITFRKYEYNREGFGHGMYTESFHTFDLETGDMLTNSDIFKDRTLSGVRTALSEVIAEDPHYTQWLQGPVSAVEIEKLITAWQSSDAADEGIERKRPDRQFRLPTGALTETGVLFSFQPYEIQCWAAGAFHFIVPYSRLMPYLRPKAKELIKTMGQRRSSVAEG